MNYLLIPATWFFLGVILSVLAALSIFCSLFLKDKITRKMGSYVLVAGVVITFGALVLGDWNIPECYDSQNQLMSDESKCVFP